MKTLVADVDTINDLRYKAKFGPNQFALQLTQYDSVHRACPVQRVRGDFDADPDHPLGGFGAGPGTDPARARELCGSHDTHQQRPYGGWWVHEPSDHRANYTAVRDSLMKEERISTVFEGSNDRVISIRMYDLETIADTTFHNLDLHTTVLPVPSSEVQGRGGSYNLTCP